MTARYSTRPKGDADARPRRKDDSSASPRASGGKQLRAAGLGVAAQFSLATVLTLAVSLVVFVVVVYQVLAGALSDEIDEAGVAAVRAMAVTDPECWKEYHGTLAAGMEGQSTLRVPIPPDRMPDFEARVAANRRRAQRLAEGAGSKILDAAVLDVQMTSVWNGRGTIQFRATDAERQIGEVTVRRGVYDSSNVRTQARTYTAPILWASGQPGAFAVVALSEGKIDDTLTGLVLKLVGLTLLFIALAILPAKYVSKRVTRPIAILCDDIEAVAAGDLEHRTHAHSADEIGVLARTFDRMTQNLHQLQDIERQQAAQEHQIEVAREVQAALLPEKLPPIAGYECAAASRPASKVAGDFYDVFDMAGGAKLLVVVSASGGGVPGAMVVTMARSFIKAAAGGGSSPAELLRRVNHMLAPDLRRGMYVSALLVRLVPGESRLTVANAGHHPLLLCRKGSDRAEPVHSDGIALGFDKGPIFDRTIKDRELELAAGDRILLCTRSLFGLHDAEGREIGEEAVYRLFARESPKNSDAFVPLTLGALEKFREGAEKSTDITFLTVKRLA